MLSYADSPDLVQWVAKGNAVTDYNGEGPKVINWRGRYWLIADTWANGIRVWSSHDALNWQPQEETLIGSHGDVVVSGDRAWWFYFGSRRLPSGPAVPKGMEAMETGLRGRRFTAINVVELSVVDDHLIAAPPELPTTINLLPEREPER